MTTTHKATIGSISSGTLRNEDLLQAFADELYALCPNSVHLALIAEARELLDPTVMYELLQEDGPEMVNNLIDALNDYAPPFCYFGTLEGDGADFGFWPDREAIDTVIDNSTSVYSVGHLGEYVNWDEGLYIQISDHGNITISRIEIGETLLAIV